MPDIKNMPEAVGFWEGIEQGEFRIQRCTSCGGFQLIPKGRCPHDGEKMEWITASGRGVVQTFSIIPAHPNPEFHKETPYAVGIVLLEEGIGFYTRFQTDHPEEIYIGMPVEAVFVNVTDDQRLVYFTPLEKAG